MAGEPELISLLYRADWTRLWLSAEVNDGSRLLIAPGRRYRWQEAGHLTGCDGSRLWSVFPDRQADPDEMGEDAELIGGPEPPIPMLLCPAWLLWGSELDMLGPVRACGRDALRVAVSRRAGPRARMAPGFLPEGGAEVIVDAELGILLRLESRDGGKSPQVTEVIRLELEPAVEEAQFAPPPGSLAGRSAGEASGPGGAGLGALKTVAGVAAGGLGAWIRYSPFGSRGPAPAGATDAEAAIASDEPAPELSRDGRPAGPDVPNEILPLLHRSAAATFAATLHEWYEVGAMLSQVPAGARRAGFGGLGLLTDSISERVPTAHLVSTLHIAGDGRYRVDHSGDTRRGPQTIACDGQRRWQVYRDKVTTGPAEPAPASIDDLTDASWLLVCRLSGGTPVTVGGRPGYRIQAGRGGGGWPAPMLFPAAVAVVDAELGILLRLTCYLGGRPVLRSELRGLDASAGTFRFEVPAGMPVREETSLFDDAAGGPGHPAGPLMRAAGSAARHAATGAARAAGNFLARWVGEPGRRS